ncbi:MAG: NAD(P)/FAD-dependent oxidoreductase [Neptuniibacter sp.]
MNRVKPHVAIIGAGLSGAVLCDLLLQAGYQVTVFDKSRGTGGRLASCRLSDYTADLGAPFIQHSGSPFSEWIREQEEVKQWQPRVYDFDGIPVESTSCYTAAPRQSALTRRLLTGAEFRPSTRVGFIWPELVSENNSVVVRDEKGKGLGYFDAVVVATPAQQAAPLLESIPRFMKKASAINYDISWVHVLVTYSEEPINTPDLLSGEHKILSRITKDSAKPGRQCPVNTEVWTIEANEQWSRRQRDSDKEEVALELRKAFLELLPSHSNIIAERTHRWLYARHTKTNFTHLWDADTGIGVCGDWFAAGGAEAAWLSACSLAGELTDYLGSSCHIENEKPTPVSISL